MSLSSQIQVRKIFFNIRKFSNLGINILKNVSISKAIIDMLSNQIRIKIILLCTFRFSSEQTFEVRTLVLPAQIRKIW